MWRVLIHNTFRGDIRVSKLSLSNVLGCIKRVTGYPIPGNYTAGETYVFVHVNDEEALDIARQAVRKVREEGYSNVYGPHFK